MIDRIFPPKGPSKVDREALKKRDAEDAIRYERSEKVIAESRRIQAMIAEMLPHIGDVMADMVGKPIRDV